MLHVIVKNVAWMRKYKVISQDTYKEFKMGNLSPPETQSDQLTSYIQKQKNERRAKSEYLIFDSMLESGNLDRVEA